MSPEPNLFPLGVATGSAHCNRKEERAELAGNVLTGAHTWLWGQRRMGKTSLVEQVLQDLASSRRKVWRRRSICSSCTTRRTWKHDSGRRSSGSAPAWCRRAGNRTESSPRHSGH